ncbi:MAG: hypothetical protein KME06_21780 [Kastovskya adunca ATA6-11-RM4]|jgi:hypothetical protein|nr:hypothetical protein [Kastovskya adunca ATA6-11-RM4]
MKMEFFASSFEAIETNLYIGFSETEGGEHYFIMTRDEASQEEAVPNRKNIYVELDDENWSEDVGINKVILSRNQIIISFGSDTINLPESDEIIINFSLKDSDFERLQNVLQKIMLVYEDRLSLIN